MGGTVPFGAPIALIPAFRTSKAPQNSPENVF
jgi:hypothetical protein